jgi:putative AlgH/UPF0301 family transcriptional regulator
MMNLNYDFFKIDKILKPKKGRLLISEPFLQDAYFKRSVIVIAELLRSENESRN